MWPDCYQEWLDLNTFKGGLTPVRFNLTPRLVKLPYQILPTRVQARVIHTYSHESVTTP